MNELPLQELFTRLREAGLPLGIDEYQLVLQSLQVGFGMTDKGALKRLCQTLWVKSAEEKRIFEYQFEQLIGTEAVVPSSETLVKSIEKRKIDRIIDYLALAGAFIIGFWIISSGIGFFMNRNQTQLNKNLIQQIVEQIQIWSSGSTNNQTPNTKANQNLNQTPKINQNQSQINWSAIAQITLSIVLVLVTGTTLTAFVYKLYTWIDKRVLSKQKVGNDKDFPEATSSAPSSSVLPAKLTQETEDEVQVAQAVLKTTSRNEEILHSRFLLTSEYFPITERQMKQVWRYLRRPVREGQPTELDMEATVNQIGRQGILLQPVLVPRRVNQADLLLLIDQDGSMVPFHTLSRRLAETAMRGGRLGKADIYYFHNCPIEYLYHDFNHQKEKLISDIVTHVCSNRTAVLIFSDAGAARGGYSKERYELTKEFLTKLKQKVRYIAWLNPMPHSRWNKTTAGEIAGLLPMFEVSRPGVQDAISVLRGRPTNFEGRKK
ncbi:MAG: hypothetical protein KME46_28000 [Brasilonema angustatum HA4187-MV1]|nr:hypothetical protein [Brasilonema angustatum HA4187-MV1]